MVLVWKYLCKRRVFADATNLDLKIIILKNVILLNIKSVVL